MIVEFADSFVKCYKKRILGKSALVKRMKERIEMFRLDQSHPLLKDHALSGSRRTFRAFWITGDIRIVYQQVSIKHVRFIDIGSHNQVY